MGFSVDYGSNAFNLADKVKGFEGFAPRASWDYKQNSVGYGTRAKYPGEVISRDEADNRLRAELAQARAIVDRHAPNAPEGVKNALTSLTYNAGDQWTRSGLGQSVAAGDYETARQRFLQYNKAGGQVLPGLQKRREQEAQWFNAFGPSQPASPLQSSPTVSQSQVYGPPKPKQMNAFSNAPKWDNGNIVWNNGDKTILGQI